MASSTEIVKLNIGGTVFQTTKSTLTRFDGFFRTILETDVPVTKDEFGALFIDRSPKHFDLILNFMRDGDVKLPDCKDSIEEISKEAQYYLLTGLVELCSNHSQVESSNNTFFTSPSSEQCTIDSPANSTTSTLAGGSSNHISTGSTRPVALTCEQKSLAPMLSTLSIHLSASDKFDLIMNMPPPAQYIQEQHSWNPRDRSMNIYVKDEDKFTVCRRSVLQSTDGIRGKIGFSQGFHVWQIVWPEKQRGTHAMVGVATMAAPLHANSYTALIGTTKESYGWNITRRECHHDSNNIMTWRYPVGNSPDANKVPDKFYCILDMDEGYMAFATDKEYLGVAFRNLKGKTLYPVVAAVWGNCEISMRYLGTL